MVLLKGSLCHVDGAVVEGVTDDSVDGASHLGGWSDG